MRRALDSYYTPESAIRSLLEHYPQIRGELLLDPCCGDGRMARMLLQAGRFSRAHLNDLNPLVSANEHHDGADLNLCRADWEVSNPPFVASGDIVRASLQRARSGVAMLLRCTFLEPCGPKGSEGRNGRRWLVECPPTSILSIPRISFTGDGSTDSAGCWWFVWERAASGWKRGGITVALQHSQQIGLGL